MSEESKAFSRWYHRRGGGHTHIKVFIGNGKAGDLCCENHEFNALVAGFASSGLVPKMVQFIDEDVPPPPTPTVEIVIPETIADTTMEPKLKSFLEFMAKHFCMTVAERTDRSDVTLGRDVLWSAYRAYCMENENKS